MPWSKAKLRERGEAAFNARDHIHRRRATTLNADRWSVAATGAGAREHLAIDAT